VLTAGCSGSEKLSCGDAVMVDWNNGRLGDTYAPECYRDALGAMPEDARLYTTAPEDIKRALRASLAARAPRPESGRNQGRAGEAAAGEPSRQLSGRQREPKAEATAAPAPGEQSERTSLPWPVAVMVTLILAACVGGATSSVGRRRHLRRRAP
jgi:hypothetical protein